MKTIREWGKPVSLIAVTFSTLVGLNTPVMAVNPPTTDSVVGSNSVKLAQGAGIIGQCRAAKKPIFVYTDRSTSSQTVTTIRMDQEVTLADNGRAGWIAISSPATGYVQAMDLKACQGSSEPNNNPPNSTGNVCRKVIVAEGLTIRQSASPTAASVGGVLVGSTIKLASPPQSQKDSQGRTWIQITGPKAGWVSSGFPQGNLGPEFTCP